MRPKWGLPDALSCWLAGFGGAIIAFAFGGAIGATLDGTAFLFIVAVPFQYAAILATVVVISRTKGTGSLRHDFGLTLWPTRRQWFGQSRWFGLGVVAFGAALQLVLALLLTPIAHLAHLSKEPQELVRRTEHGTGLGLVLVIVVATAIVAPVVEELVFRGVLLRALLRRTTDGWAIVGSAGVFAAAHLTDPGAGFVLPGLFGLGLVLGYLATRDRDLARPILVHGGFNLFATVLSLSHR